MMGIGDARLKTGSVIMVKPSVLIKTVEWPSQENLESINSLALNTIDGSGFMGFLPSGGKNQSFKEGSIWIGLFLSTLFLGAL